MKVNSQIARADTKLHVTCHNPLHSLPQLFVSASSSLNSLPATLACKYIHSRVAREPTPVLLGFVLLLPFLQNFAGKHAPETIRNLIIANEQVRHWFG